MEKPGETCSCSPHPSSSKPTPAPEAKFSRRSGRSPAIRTPSICSSWPAWQPTGRSSAALLLAPRRDCRGSNPSTPWIKNPSTRRSHLHLRLRICIVQVCTTPRRQPSSSANSSSSAIVDKELGVGDLVGAGQGPGCTQGEQRQEEDPERSRLCRDGGSLTLVVFICLIHVCTKPAAALILSSSSHSPSTIGKGPGVGNCPGAEQRPRNESSDEEKAMAPLFIFGGVLSAAGGEARAVRLSPAPSR